MDCRHFYRTNSRKNRENNDEFSSENLEEFLEISKNKMGEKQIPCQCNCQIEENEKNEIFDQPETISDIGISCSQRCSNWFRILTFMMINGKGSQYTVCSILYAEYFVKILKRYPYKLRSFSKAVYVSIGAYGFSSLEREYEKAMCADAYTIFTNFTDR